MKKIRFIDNTNNAHITEIADSGQLKGFNRGDVISPFETKQGRVQWRLDYIEDIDIYTTFAYITHLGYAK